MPVASEFSQRSAQYCLPASDNMGKVDILLNGFGLGLGLGVRVGSYGLGLGLGATG